MKKTLFTFSIFILIASVFIGTKEYKAQIGQDCGEPIVIERRVNWVWEWWPNRDSVIKIFPTCVGPSTYIVYRPLDVMVFGILLSANMALFARERKINSEKYT